MAVFMIGRLSVGIGDDPSAADDGKKGGQRSSSVLAGEGGNSLLRAKRERSRRMTENRRAHELKSILAGFGYGYSWQSDDPFGGSSFNSVDRARLFAWIMQSELSDFPEVMQLASKMENYGGSDQELLGVMLARWVEFDPAAAMSWAQEYELSNEDGNLHERQLFMAHEALAYHPDWAIAKLKTAALAKIAEYKQNVEAGVDVDDPFDDNYLNLDLDAFYRRIAILFPAERESFMAMLGEEVFEYGESGWLEGLAESAGNGGLEALAELAKDPETGMIDSRAFAIAAKKNWKQARDWLRLHGGNYELDATVWSYARTEDYDKAADWYLSRSKDSGDREVRINDIVRSFGNGPDRLQWIQKMEAAGEPIQKAWDHAVNTMASSGDVEGVMKYVSKVSPDYKKHIIESAFERVSNGSWLSLGDESVYYYTPKKEQREVMMKNPAYREFIRTSNREALKQFMEHLADVEEQLDAQ